jgi:hypothetical protein
MSDVKTDAPVENQVEEVSEENLTEEELAALEAEEGEEKAKEEQKDKEAAKSTSVKRFKLKVDGKEEEEEIDLANEAELVKRLQLAKVAQKRMQESAADKKTVAKMNEELKEFVIALKEDPFSVLSDPRFGLDLKKLAYDYVAKEVEQATKTPEQREAEAKEAKAKELEEKLAKLEKEKIESEKKSIQEKYEQELQKGIIESIKESGLPEDEPEVLKRYAQAMKIGLKFKMELNPKELGPIIKQQLYQESKKFASFLKDEEFEEFAGVDRIKNVRKKMLDKIKTNVTSSKQIKDTGSEKDEDSLNRDKKKYVRNSKSFWKDLEKGS